MGQRSQIYVRFDDGNKKGLIANYYGWNYGERMISRARYGIEAIKETLKYKWYYQQPQNVEKTSRIFDTNFDMKDVAISCDIIKEKAEQFPEEDFKNYVFLEQDNNDGKLLVDIDNENQTIKYAFLDDMADTTHIMDAESYMKWDDDEDWRKNKYLTKEDITACEENIKVISDMAQLMTQEEVEEFMNYDYEMSVF